MHSKITLALLTALCILTTIVASRANATPIKTPIKAVTKSNLHSASIDDIKRIETYLSKLSTIKASFTQVAPNGELSEGTFYLKRPGKMRWQYNPPTPILLVSNGSTFTYYDAELDQVNYIDVDDTLASFLGRDDIRMESDITTITESSAESGVIRITLVEKKKPNEGALSLEFSETPLALRNMIITDATGATTRIALQNAEFGLALDNALFVFKDPRGVKTRKRR